jgi:regulatory factor X, other
MASEQAEAGKGSDDEDDDESDGPSSANASKRNSLNLANGAKQVVFADEKTPTAASLLSQAQASQRPPSSSFPSQAPIRRHAGPGDSPLAVPSPSDGAVPLPMMGAPQTASVRHIPHFPNIEEALGANSTSPQGVAAREVWSWFQDHLDALLESVRTYRFDQFEMHVRTFWSSLTGAHREVVHAPAVAGLMAKADAIVYDVSVLFTVVLCMVAYHPVRKFWSSCARRCCPRSRLLSSAACGSLQTRWRRFCS